MDIETNSLYRSSGTVLLIFFYLIPENGNVKIKVFDNTGKEVATLVNEFRNAGFYNVQFDGSALTSGVYYYKLETQNFSAVRKMILLK